VNNFSKLLSVILLQVFSSCNGLQKMVVMADYSKYISYVGS
jgi:hypothetical protein